MHRGKSDVPQAWGESIQGWATWLRVAGKRETTIKLRVDHVRAIARRSSTNHPREITLNLLVILCSAQNWSLEHRKGVRTSLNSFFDWAVQMGVVDHNPAAQMPRVEAPTPRPRPAPDDVWVDLLAAAAPRERLMALLAGEGGLRRAEVAATHSDDLIRDLSGWSLIVHGKGGRQRVVPLNSRLALEVRGFVTRRGHLFPGNRRCDHHRGICEGHITPEWVGTIISELMPDGWTMHKLRHRFATRAYAGTRNLRGVQEVLGHTSVATTQRYTAVSSSDVRLVVEAAGPLPELQ